MSRMQIGVQLPEVEYEVAWPDLIGMARAAEAAGFDSIWLGDHLLYDIPDVGPRGPWEVWTSLAALAVATERVMLGPLVASTSFHAPAMLAKLAATVDGISGGRLILGLGAGWNRREYEAFGFPFDHRVDRFEEAFTIVRSLLRDGRCDFNGRYHTATDCVLHPMPARPGGPPILLGSWRPRMLAIGLPHVDAWNVWWSDYGNTPVARSRQCGGASTRSPGTWRRWPPRVPRTCNSWWTRSRGPASSGSVTWWPPRGPPGPRTLAHAARGADHGVTSRAAAGKWRCRVRARRIDGVDAAFLAGETAAWPFHVSALQILDPTGVAGFGFRAYRTLLAERIGWVPQLRWLLRPAPLRLGWSYFVEAPEFCLDDHLHRVAVASPGGPHDVAALVGDLIAIRIDRSRPLWESWFIEGLAGGRVAVLTKVHHSIIDGVSGVEVFAALSDAVGPFGASAEPEAPVASPPSRVEHAARNAAHAMTVPLRVARFGRDLVGRGLAAAPLALGPHPAALPFRSPRTPFNGRLTPRRAFASTSLPLDLVKEVRAAAGVKVNDVILAVCAGVLRDHLSALDALPGESLVAQVPMSTRGGGSRGGTGGEIGTQVGALFVSLATDVADPRDRIAAIHASALAAKRLRAAMSDRPALGVSQVVPPPLVTMAARAWDLARLDTVAPPAYNVIVSTVAGPPVNLTAAGARIEAMYPLGPLLYGGGLNISTFTHGGTIDVGVVTCRDLVPDPWLLAERFPQALDDLASAVFGRRHAKAS